MVLLMLNETILFLTMVRSHWRGWHIVLFEGGKRARRSRVEAMQTALSSGRGAGSAPGRTADASVMPGAG